MDDAEAHELLLRIARCDVLSVAARTPEHPCHAVVHDQAPAGLLRRDHRLPEPWSGSLDSPILFIGLNPNDGGPSDGVPTRSSSDGEILDYYSSRFENESIVGGSSIRRAGQLEGVKVWKAALEVATQLLGRRATPGKDYALTNIVHCKCAKGSSAKKAVRFCSSRYMASLMDASKAKVIVALGSDVVVWTGVKPPAVERVTLAGHDITVVALPHPSNRNGLAYLPESALPSAAVDQARVALRRGPGNQPSARRKDDTSLPAKTTTVPQGSPRTKTSPSSPTALQRPSASLPRTKMLDVVRGLVGRQYPEYVRTTATDGHHYVDVGPWWSVAFLERDGLARVEVLLEDKDRTKNDQLFRRLERNKSKLMSLGPLVFDFVPARKRQKVMWDEAIGRLDRAAADRTAERMIALIEATEPIIAK